MKEKIKELEADHTLVGNLDIHLGFRGNVNTFYFRLEQGREGTLQLSEGSLGRIREIFRNVAQNSFTAGQDKYRSILKKSSLLAVLKFKWKNKDSL